MNVRPPTSRVAAGLACALLLLGTACSDSVTAPSTDDADIELAIVAGNGQVGVVGQMLGQPLTVRVGSRSAPVEGALVNFVVVGGGGSVWAGSALTDRHGIAREWWTLGTRADSIQRLEVRAVRSNGNRVVHGAFTATAQPDVPAMIDRVVPPTVTAELLDVLPAPGLRVFDRYMNPVPNHPVRFNVVGGRGTVVDTIWTDATGTAFASWQPGAYSATDSIARVRMRPGLPFVPAIASDTMREVRTNVYPTTGLTLVPMPIDSDSGQTNVPVTFCVGIHDAQDAAVQPSRHHPQAIAWTRDGGPMTNVSLVGFAGSSICFQLAPRSGTHLYRATIRGMAGDAAFTFTGT